jgi:tetratricopeptide (TPR) repeat protein
MTRDADLADQYRMRAIGLLDQARADGLRDGTLDANLAHARSDAKLGDVASLAESALADGGLDPQDRCNALLLLAESLARDGRHKEAIPLLQKLAKLRRHSAPLLLLADCQRKTGDESYVETLQQAVAISPRLWKVHQHLADHYRRAGDKTKAAYHRKRAVP